MNDLPIINLLPPKWRPWVIAVIALHPYVTRAVYALRKNGGLRGVVNSIWLGTNVPAAGKVDGSATGETHNPS